MPHCAVYVKDFILVTFQKVVFVLVFVFLLSHLSSHIFVIEMRYQWGLPFPGYRIHRTMEFQSSLSGFYIDCASLPCAYVSILPVFLRLHAIAIAIASLF